MMRGGSGRNSNHNKNRSINQRSAGDRYNRLSRQDNRYSLDYDFGRGRTGAQNRHGYADTNRSHDTDWDNGRNVYWREKYHHQGHPDDRDRIQRLEDRVREAWDEWFEDESTKGYHRSRHWIDHNYDNYRLNWGDPNYPEEH